MARIGRRSRGTRSIASRVRVCLALALLLLPAAGLARAQEGRFDLPESSEQVNEEFRHLFDAVLNGTRATFWNKERMQAVDWEARAEQARADVVGAATLTEAVQRLNGLLDLLETSHTGLFTPDDVFYYLQKDVFWRSGSYAGIGTFSQRIDGRDFIDAILDGSAADKAGLKVGDEIVAVDGAAYHPIRSFRDKAGRTADVTIRRRRDGPPETLAVAVEMIAPVKAFGTATLASARVIEHDGRRIGYVRAWSSLGDSETALAEALARFGIGRWRDQKVRLTPTVVDGLIVDMRGKVGGYLGMVARYLELIDPRGPDVTYPLSLPRGAWGSVRGRNAVLIDQRTRSAGELFAHAYKRERQGPLIGTRTAGAVSAGALQSLPAGCVLHLAITGLTVDGEVLEGTGVAPDIEVANPIPYAAGADPVLAAAVAWLARNAAARDATEPQGKGN